MGRNGHRGLVFRWTNNPTEGVSHQAIHLPPGYMGVFFTMGKPEVFEIDLRRLGIESQKLTFELTVAMASKADEMVISGGAQVIRTITTTTQVTCWEYQNRSSMQVVMLAMCATNIGRLHDLMRAKIPHTASKFNLPPPTPEEMKALLVRY